MLGATLKEVYKVSDSVEVICVSVAVLTFIVVPLIVMSLIGFTVEEIQLYLSMGYGVLFLTGLIYYIIQLKKTKRKHK